MASVITADPVERTSLSSWRTLGGQMAGLVINVVGPIILFVNNKPDANRFIIAALIFGGLAIACYMACYKLSVERIVMDETNKEKVNFGQTMKGLTKNKPLMVFLVAALAFMIVFMLIGTVNVYLFKDYFTNAKALSMVGLLQAVAVFVAMPFIQPLVKRFGKKEVASNLEMIF